MSTISNQPEQMEFRAFRIEDRAGVLKLNETSLADVDVDTPPGYFDDFYEIESRYLDSGTFLVAVAEDKIVGMGGLHVFEPGAARIRRMRVHPDYQRQGIARRILTELEVRAAQLGVGKVLVNTPQSQLTAQKFYETQGYTSTGEGAPDGFEVVMYEKYL